MARALWAIQGGGIKDDGQQISNVSLTITDITNQIEGETVTAVCNGKTFSSVMTKGICKIYSTEVGTYTITAGEYSTMLVCPYFGQFSTDIYSGTLKITCTESGGNGKVCHVQSCDNDYNFTDDYNLTQTFDGDLELIFLGIPAGQYLITVDERYRFFKEIVSIQNVNKTEVELKQWLYKNGDECVHNTGGWLKCQVSGKNTPTLSTCDCAQYRTSTSSCSQSLDFLSNIIRINQSCISNATNHWNSGFSGEQFGRTPVSSNAFCGINKNLPIKISKYSRIICNATQPVTATLRSGPANDENTNTATGTILASGSGNEIEINTIDSIGTIVIGKAYSADGCGFDRSAWKWYKDTREWPGNINYNFNADVSEVYLV